MAVVLPVHSHIGFSNPNDNDYDCRCQNEEDKAGGERIKKNEVDVFANDENEEGAADDNNRSCCSPLDENAEEEDIDESEHKVISIQTDCMQKNQDEINVRKCDKPEKMSVNHMNTNEEEKFASDCGDNYWLMGNDTTKEIPSNPCTNTDECHNTVDESPMFISSPMSVDPTTSINKKDDEIENEETAVFNVPNSQDSDCQKRDDMEIEIDEIPILEGSIPTAEIAETKTSEAVSPDGPFYGGLENLGNTCYMASAIQLLCGLDNFSAELENRIPPDNVDKNDGNVGDSKIQSLRNELIEVMDRLGNGETVRPDSLKRCIDSRTSLFLGYHQQDSHEFLTTLLDMIDEDYKVKTKPEETSSTTTRAASDKNDDSNNISGENCSDESNAMSEKLVKQSIADTNSEQLTFGHENEVNEQESNNDENNFDNDNNGSDQKSLESALKRPKLVDEEVDKLETNTTAMDTIESRDEPNDIASIELSKSYREFKFSDIENLLHDNDNSSARARKEEIKKELSFSSQSQLSAKQDEPKCKLAGGRMSTAGVELTRFVQDSDIDDNVRPTGASLDKATPQQQIVEGQLDVCGEGDSDESPSPVSSNFTTKVRVSLTCESCKFRRSHVETYLHLSLDIGTGSNDDDDVCNLGCPSSSSIEDGLRKFFAPEKRDIKCEKCFHTSALQTTEITQLPRNMLFHLKRFIVDVSPDYSSISYRKDQSEVVFNERIELDTSEGNNENDTQCHASEDEEGGFRNFLALDCSYPKGAAYEIRSVVNHIGSSASCGHYTADAKRKRRTDGMDEEENADNDANNSNNFSQINEEGREDRQWTRFNDSYVTAISPKEAIQDSSKTAYMIMYELVG